MNLNPRILKKNGKNEFVVLTYDEYLALQEHLNDMQDLLDLRVAKRQEGDKESLPLAVLEQELEEQSTE